MVDHPGLQCQGIKIFQSEIYEDRITSLIVIKFIAYEYNYMTSLIPVAHSYKIEFFVLNECSLQL